MHIGNQVAITAKCAECHVIKGTLIFEMGNHRKKVPHESKKLRSLKTMLVLSLRIFAFVTHYALAIHSKRIDLRTFTILPRLHITFSAT